MEVSPEMGRIGQAMPSQSMSSKASQKPGMANPMNTMTVEILSKAPPRHQAAATPMGTAMSRVRIMEATFMPKVRGSRSLILSQTGRWSPGHGLAEIELHQPFQPAHVLHVQGLVQAVELFELKPRLHARLGIERGLQVRGRPRGQVDDPEADDRDPQKDHAHPQQLYQNFLEDLAHRFS